MYNHRKGRFLIGRHHGDKHAQHQARLRPQARAGGGVLRHRLTPTAVFNVFARQFVAHRGFPFAVTAPVPTEREFAAKMDSIYLSMLEGNASEHELVEA